MFKYVSLGDSIAFGMSSDLNKGYADLFSNHLKNKTNESFFFKNTAVPGWNTQDLLKSIASPSGTSFEHLNKASAVTISIGSNNLLGPVFRAIPNSGKIKKSSKSWKRDLLAQFYSAKISLHVLNQILEHGLSKFTNEFPIILSNINKKAPNAQIYVLTIYSALKSENPYFNVFNPYILRVNDFIWEMSQSCNYSVVDVYNLFTESVNPPIDFNIEKEELDPHPNNWGHQVIYNNLIQI